MSRDLTPRRFRTSLAVSDPSLSGRAVVDSTGGPPTPVDAFDAGGWRSRLRRAAGVVSVLIVLGIVAVGAHWSWTLYAERQLANYVNSLRRAGEPVTLAEVVPTRVPNPQNAALDLCAASSAVVSQDASWVPYFKLGTPALPLSAADVAAIRRVLEANAEALAHVRSAARKPAADWSRILPDSPSEPVVSSAVSGQGVYRLETLGNLLFAAALVAHQEGDDRAALARVDELLAMSRALAHRPTLQAYSYSLAREETALAALNNLVPDLRTGDAPGDAAPGQVRDLTRRLLDTRPYSQLLRRNARAERARQIAAFVPLADSTSFHPIFLAADPWGPMATSSCLPQSFKRLAMRPVRLTSEHEALLLLESTITSLDAAPAELLAAVADVPAGGRTGDDGLFIRSATIALGALAQKHCQAQAKRHATALALACSLYRAEHGALPCELAALTPRFVPALPVDPVSPDGEPFAYVTDASRPRIYSVGADGVDDGGEAEGLVAAPAFDRRVTDLVIDLVRQPARKPSGPQSSATEE